MKKKKMITYTYIELGSFAEETMCFITKIPVLGVKGSFSDCIAILLIDPLATTFLRLDFLFGLQRSLLHVTYFQGPLI